MPDNITPLDIKTSRALTLGSGCQFAFIKHIDAQTNKPVIIPVLVLTGAGSDFNQAAADPNTESRITSRNANGQVGIIIASEYENKKMLLFEGVSHSSPSTINETDWLNLNHDTDRVVYPRIFINSLKLKTDSDSLIVNYEDYGAKDSASRITNYTTLTPYEDYSILTRSVNQQYAITLKPDVIVEKGIKGSITGEIQPRQTMIKYALSNADTSIYLDAIEVAKENAVPKVSYQVKPNVFNTSIINNIYNLMGRITRINDQDLKFKNVRGYVSQITMDLDNPDNDVIGIKNYKTKFEDLFSTITAETEEMKKSGQLLSTLSTAFTSSGSISSQVMQSSLRTVDLDYAFNNGKLTIDEQNGIWGTSDSGVVAFRGGGIFTATEKDSEDKWRWNTGITPEGINADLITSGQLDTNLIRVYSGNNLRFQLNGDGMFAYKSKISDKINNKKLLDQNADTSIDGKQYVVFNDEGLSLIAKKGAKVLNSDNSDYITVLNDTDTKLHSSTMSGQQQIKRVEISWNGLVLRNWYNEDVFFADADTGNLTMTGTIHATGGTIGAWNFDGNKLWADTDIDKDGNYTTFVALNAGGTDEDEIYHGDNNTPYYTDITKKKILKVSTKDYAFWAGNPNPSKAPFFIKKEGSFKATNGKIGGWTLDNTKLYNPTSLYICSTALATNIDSTTDSYGENITPTSKTDILDGATVLYVPRSESINDVGSALLSIKKDGTLLVTDKFSIRNKDKNIIYTKSADWFSHGTFIGWSESNHKVTLNFTNATANFNTASGIKAYVIERSGSGANGTSAWVKLYPYFMDDLSSVPESDKTTVSANISLDHKATITVRKLSGNTYGASVQVPILLTVSGPGTDGTVTASSVGNITCGGEFTI